MNSNLIYIYILANSSIFIAENISQYELYNDYFLVELLIYSLVNVVFPLCFQIRLLTEDGGRITQTMSAVLYTTCF